LNKWITLVHSGPIFPKDYVYVGFDKNLSTLAEEMLYHYSAKVGTDYINSVFNKNFYKALKPELNSQYKLKKFPEDFSDLFITMNKFREDNKGKNTLSVEDKEAIKEKYGYATLNGDRQPIASPYIESAGIFCGRGKNGNNGAWKYKVNPEDCIINATNHKDIEAPYSKWKDHVENKNSFELVSYSIRLSTGRILNKKIMFAPTSIVKQTSDKNKFKKAYSLIENWNMVSDYIYIGMLSKDKHTRQCASASFLIKELGIRVGDEKDEDLADTKGATTLCKDNIELKDNTIYLSFLGKDSVLFENHLVVSPEIYFVFQNLLSYPTDQLFPFICSSDVDNYLGQCLEGLTAKVFRTAYGSSLLAEGLKNIKCKDNEKVLEFNRVNLKVAQKLNHQKQVGKTYKEKNTELKENVVNLKRVYADTKEKYTRLIDETSIKIKKINSKKLSKKDKDSLKSLHTKNKERYESMIEKAKNKLTEAEIKYKIKVETKNTALGTSKANYSDPRIIFSWCQDNNVNPDKVYSKSLQEKFNWAKDVVADFYKTYPTIKE